MASLSVKNISGVCDCGFDGYRGDYCEKKECPGYNISCSGHGNCNPTTGQCLCDPGWIGVGCHIAKCLNDCNNAGTCLPLDEPVCNCNAGFFGSDCGHYCHHGDIITPNPNDWSTQYCQCDACHTGIDCNIECSAHGTCNNGICDCGSDGWKGKKCEIAGCPGKNGTDCSNHGNCIISSASDIGNSL